MGRSCSQNGRALKIVTDKPKGRRLLGRPMLIWEDNIRMDIKEIHSNTRNCLDSSQDMDYWRALMNAALKHNSIVKNTDIISS